MFKTLLLIMAMCINMANAMTLDEYSGDCPPNYREIMPTEFIACAKLATDQKFDEGIDAIRHIHGNNKYFNADKICSALKKVYDFAKKEINSPVKIINNKEYSLDPNITEKMFIYEHLLRYFWWKHCYPFFEGLSNEIILDLEAQYFKS